MNALRPYIQAGVPIVGLEPSCAAVFRDELGELFPDNEDAKRLKKQTYLLSEFLTKVVKNYQPPPLPRKAIGHGHCHHKSIMGMDDEWAILKKMGVDATWPESSCCGMAGSFGFEAGLHYDVSIACGERALLPAVRQADPEALILANGFSCREQIEQTTDRRPLHLAQVIQMALHQDRPELVPPSADDAVLPGKTNVRELEKALLVGGAAVLGGVLLGMLTKRAGSSEGRARR